MRPVFLVFWVVSIGCLVLLLVLLGHGNGFPILFPSGSIGGAERDLMVRTVFLMLIVVVPVYLVAIFIAWHYRASNTRATYTPKWEHSKMEELIWWAIPFEIVLVLSALTWTSTHQLNPELPIVSSQPPMVVQVVALPWKWLFIYPADGVASVNELAMPVDRPVTFQITADAPMNSFWIPALGGQEYAMTGMTTVLNLMATKPGTYAGRSANYSGEGFAHMKFAARAMSQADFDAWILQAKQSSDVLSSDSFNALAQPSSPASDTEPVRYYGSVSMPFQEIVHSTMGPMTISSRSHLDMYQGETSMNP
jgi:cytochrome o ubiquinol oxidase subunit 2